MATTTAPGPGLVRRILTGRPHRALPSDPSPGRVRRRTARHGDPGYGDEAFA